jgi:Domain of unknown function (DUF397)
MTNPTWRKASRCGSAASCVEVRFTTGCTDLGVLHADCDYDDHPKVPVVEVRDSKVPGQHALVFDLEEWATFSAAVKAGEFDVPSTVQPQAGPTPNAPCAPTPNGLICACGGAVSHDGGRQ